MRTHTKSLNSLFCVSNSLHTQTLTPGGVVQIKMLLHSDGVERRAALLHQFIHTELEETREEAAVDVRVRAHTVCIHVRV